MKQSVVNTLSEETYYPYYKEHSADPTVKAAVAAIIKEEGDRCLGLLQTTRGIRTRVSELLQGRIPVVDPKMIATTNARQMREQVENHHNHQTAHFQAIWRVTDELVRAMGFDIEAKVPPKNAAWTAPAIAVHAPAASGTGVVK